MDEGCLLDDVGNPGQQVLSDFQGLLVESRHPNEREIIDLSEKKIIIGLHFCVSRQTHYWPFYHCILLALQLLVWFGFSLVNKLIR